MTLFLLLLLLCKLCYFRNLQLSVIDEPKNKQVLQISDKIQKKSQLSQNQRNKANQLTADKLRLTQQIPLKTIKIFENNSSNLSNSSLQQKTDKLIKSNSAQTLVPLEHNFQQQKNKVVSLHQNESNTVFLLSNSSPIINNTNKIIQQPKPLQINTTKIGDKIASSNQADTKNIQAADKAQSGDKQSAQTKAELKIQQPVAKTDEKQERKSRQEASNLSIASLPKSTEANLNTTVNTLASTQKPSVVQPNLINNLQSNKNQTFINITQKPQKQQKQLKANTTDANISKVAIQTKKQDSTKVVTVPQIGLTNKTNISAEANKTITTAIPTTIQISKPDTNQTTNQSTIQSSSMTFAIVQIPKPTTIANQTNISSTIASVVAQALKPNTTTNQSNITSTVTPIAVQITKKTNTTISQANINITQAPVISQISKPNITIIQTNISNTINPPIAEVSKPNTTINQSSISIPVIPATVQTPKLNLTTNQNNNTGTNFNISLNLNTSVTKKEVQPINFTLPSPPSNRTNDIFTQFDEFLATLNDPFTPSDLMSDRGLAIRTRNPAIRQNPKFRVVKNVSMPFRIKKSLLDLKNIKRDINGKNNNEFNRDFGAINTSMKRKCKANFIDGRSIPVSDLPSPRQISNTVGTARNPIQLNKENVTLAFTLWGQFIDHDIQQSPTSDNQGFHIPIPRCDKFLDVDCNGTRVIPFSRSVSVSNAFGPRSPINSITTWLDASMVYGSTQDQARKLRKFQKGLMKTNPIDKGFLPPGKRVQPSSNPTLRSGFDPNISNETMQAGDSRSNENLVLLSFHTIFLRQHNRLCQLIIRNQQNLSDEQIYWIARNYVTGLIQKITYDDFLPPLLGESAYKRFIGAYPGYDRNIDPSIQVQFSTVAFRYGHSLVVPQFPLVNLFGDKLQFIRMDAALFRPDLLTEQNLQKILRGTSRTITKLRDGQFVDQVRNFVVISPQIRTIRLDLLAINIQRGRDHGIPDYNSLRQCYGLRRLNSFSQISEQSQMNQKIRRAYNNNINKIDSYIGVQAQKSVPGSVLGETAIEIIGSGFQKIRNGDRFWYQKVFPSDIIAEIKETTLSQVIIRNTFITQLQQDIFHYSFDIK